MPAGRIHNQSARRWFRSISCFFIWPLSDRPGLPGDIALPAVILQALAVPTYCPDLRQDSASSLRTATSRRKFFHFCPRWDDTSQTQVVYPGPIRFEGRASRAPCHTESTASAEISTNPAMNPAILKFPPSPTTPRLRAGTPSKFHVEIRSWSLNRVSALFLQQPAGNPDLMRSVTPESGWNRERHIRLDPTSADPAATHKRFPFPC